MTEIGERGVNISGGQKQRISLARLCYSRNEIVLLDDPLSAVDAEVGKHIFDKCIKELLHGKTILLVTHQLHFVSQCDLVVVMSGGEVVEFGSPKDLICKPDGLLAKLLQDSETSQDEGTKKTSSVHDMTEIPVSVTRTEAKGLMSKEERVTGAVDSSVLKAYGEAAGGLFFVVPFIAILVFMQLSRMATDLWLVYWTQQSVPGMTESTYLSIYGGLATFQMALVFTFAFLVALGGTRAAQTLHVKSIKSVFAAPMYFFDTTPLGRIISRFSRDQDQADNTLTDALRLFLMTFTTTISTFLLVAYITSGYFLIPFFPLCIAYYFLQKIYRSTSRELKRLESISRVILFCSL